MLIDALAHLTDPRIRSLDAILGRAQAAGIDTIVSAGTNPLTEAEIPVTPAEAPSIKRAFGIHPASSCTELLPQQLEKLRCQLKRDDVVALGELGLDRRAGMPSLEAQLPAFRAQLILAQEQGLPIILHGVSAVGLLLEELEAVGPLSAGGIWHGFTGPAEILPSLVKLNLSVSLGALVTNPKASRCHKVAETVSLSRLLVESDCPDHPTPASEHGIGEPSHLPEIISAIAQHRSESAEVIAEATARNALELYQLD